MLGELLIPAGFVLAIDQASKQLVCVRFAQAPRSQRPIGWKPRLRPLLSKTIAQGFVRDRHALLILWSLAAVGTILLVGYAPPLQSWTARVGLGAALGGATGNLIDQLRRGAVMDFIDLRIWPVFNFADTFIVVGLGVALWSIQ
jgi:signal peptidase II